MSNYLYALLGLALMLIGCKPTPPDFRRSKQAVVKYRDVLALSQCSRDFHRSRGRWPAGAAELKKYSEAEWKRYAIKWDEFESVKLNEDDKGRLVITTALGDDLSQRCNGHKTFTDVVGVPPSAKEEKEVRERQEELLLRIHGEKLAKPSPTGN